MSSCDPLPGLIPLSLTTDSLLTLGKTHCFWFMNACVESRVFPILLFVSLVCFIWKVSLGSDGDVNTGKETTTIIICKVTLPTSKDLMSNFWICYGKLLVGDVRSEKRISRTSSFLFGGREEALLEQRRAHHVSCGYYLKAALDFELWPQEGFQCQRLSLPLC